MQSRYLRRFAGLKRVLQGASSLAVRRNWIQTSIVGVSCEKQSLTSAESLSPSQPARQPSTPSTALPLDMISEDPWLSLARREVSMVSRSRRSRRGLTEALVRAFRSSLAIRSSHSAPPLSSSSHFGRISQHAGVGWRATHALPFLPLVWRIHSLLDELCSDLGSCSPPKGV